MSAVLATRLFEDSEGAARVHLVRCDRIGDRARHGSERGEVDDGADTVGRGGERIGVEDAALDQARVDAVEVGPSAERQIVQRHDVADGVVLCEMTAQVGSDEPGTAGHEHVHAFCPFTTRMVAITNRQVREAL